jgi:glycosyltransferase involved in cell wall biosynthesis
MPSQGEGFGIVLIEAAACGVPVVGSQIDGSCEALLDGRLGRLVDPSRSTEVFDAIIEILERPPSRRRINAIDTFSVPKFMLRVDNWCREQAVRTAV